MRSSASLAIGASPPLASGRARAVPANKVEHRKALLVGDDCLAVDQAGACRQSGNRRGGQREAPGEIMAVARQEPHAGSVSPRHDAEAVMLDFVQPVPADRRSIGRTGEAGLNEVG